MLVESADLAAAVGHAAASLRAEAAAYPAGVRLWMGFMAALFATGVIFAWWRIEARLVLVTMLATAALLVVARLLWPDMPRALAGAIIHILLWPPLLGHLAVRRRGIAASMGPGRVFGTAFGLWAGLAASVLVISLVLDLRAAAALVWRLTLAMAAVGEVLA